MTQAVPGFSPPGNSPLFCLKDPDVLAREMEAAGFRDVRVTPFETHLDVESPETLWDSVTAGAPAIAGLLRRVTDEAKRVVRRTYIDLVGSRFGRGQIAMPMAFNIGIGVR